jgi:hypothetical protein
MVKRISAVPQVAAQPRVGPERGWGPLQLVLCFPRCCHSPRPVNSDVRSAMVRIERSSWIEWRIHWLPQMVLWLSAMI